MKDAVIIYEQPLNELVRVMLRLESVFNVLSRHIEGVEKWQSQQAVFAIVDAIAILDRSDLKAKIVKELSRYRQLLQRWSQTAQADVNKLTVIVEQLDWFAMNLQAVTGKFAQNLRENDFLNTLRQHRYTMGDMCNFDIPIFHHWLHQPQSQRYEDLTCWSDEFKTIKELILLLLKLIRHAAVGESRQALNGFYQEDLNRKMPLQLIRLTIPAVYPVYPKTSVSLHRLNIRFHTPNYHDFTPEIPELLDFELTRCII